MQHIRHKRHGPLTPPLQTMGLRWKSSSTPEKRIEHGATALSSSSPSQKSPFKKLASRLAGETSSAASSSEVLPPPPTGKFEYVEAC